MPRKKRTFADKMRKEKTVTLCPVCNSPIQNIFLVKSVKTEAGFWRFKQRYVSVCKCNQKEIYG